MTGEPMDPQRLAELRDLVAWFPPGATGGFLVAGLVELLADRDDAWARLREARELIERMDQRLAERQRERDEARRIAEQWRFNPWRGTTQSDPFPWEPTP